MVIKWEPPSFDPKPTPSLAGSDTSSLAAPIVPVTPLPSIEEIEAIRQAAHQEAHDQGYQEGLLKGQELGHQQGTEAGARAGYQQAYDDAAKDIKKLTTALNDILLSVKGMPEAIAAPLNELAYDIAVRIAGRESMERGPFVAAVQEALMRLPQPGENLFLRIRAEEVEIWKKIVEDPGLPFVCTILLDSEVPDGHAYVELGGAKIDIGYEARLAIIRTALGLSQVKNTSENH
jgi:flagellar assembly protein FliH